MERIVGKQNLFSNYVKEVLGERQAKGEFFGGSLVALDINGDQREDLIVGAPLYSNTLHREIGRIYVFLAKRQVWV